MSSFVAIPSCTVRSVFRIGPAQTSTVTSGTADPEDSGAIMNAVSSHFRTRKYSLQATASPTKTSAL